jgi:predicted nucleic acid-binding protein
LEFYSSLQCIITSLALPIYLDTNVWIYAIEGYSSYAKLLQEVFTQIDQGELVAVTSELTIAEVLVKPFQEDNLQVVQAYQSILQRSEKVKVIPINREILESAAKLRATTKLKLPDAIHLATAINQGAKTFITNDSGFKPMANIRIFQLADFL